MKSMIILYISFIILSFSNTVLSRSSHKFRLYDIIRKTMKENTDTIFLEVRPHKDVHSTTTTVSSIDQQSRSPNGEEEIILKPRDSSDSDEDNYFKWASQNRRPMESLVGRK